MTEEINGFHIGGCVKNCFGKVELKDVYICCKRFWKTCMHAYENMDYDK